MKSDVAILTRFQKFLYFVAKYAGLAPFIMRDNKIYPANYLSKAYNVILTASIVLCTLMMFHYKFSNPTHRTLTQNFSQSMADFLPIASSVSCILLLGFRSEMIIEIIKRIHVVGVKLMKLKTEKNYGKIFKGCTVKVTVTNVVVLAMRILIHPLPSVDNSHVVFAKFNHFHLMFTRLLHYNAVLIFIQIVDCINQGFEHLNSELKDLFRSDCETLACREPHYTTFEITRASNNRFVADQPPRGRTVRYSVKRITKIRLLHKELRDLLEYTTEFYIIPLYWIVGYQCFRLLVASFTVYKYISSSVDIFPEISSVSFTILRLFGGFTPMIIEIYYMANVCAAVCKMGNATKVILHQVWNKFRPMKLTDEFLIFSIQLLRNRVVVSIHGIFDLDYSYVYKIFYITITYLIIMIQFKNVRTDLQETKSVGYISFE